VRLLDVVKVVNRRKNSSSLLNNALHDKLAGMIAFQLPGDGERPEGFELVASKQKMGLALILI